MIPPEEGALKTCFPGILSLSLSVNLKWRDVEEEWEKGEKGICPDGNTTFNGYRHCWKAARLKSTTGKANSSRPACAAEKKKPNTEMHVQPLCIQIPTAALFPPQQLSSWLVPTRMSSKTAIIPQNPFKQGKGATSVSLCTWRGPKPATS